MHWIANFARIVPDGLLVFFPSYGVMDQCISSWKISSQSGKSIWDRIKTYKEPFAEPKDKTDFGKAMETFYAKVQDPNLIGAIFFAVCRGKASEGIDFSGSRARAVIITGLPYPAYKDPKVMLKRQFLDDIYAEEKRNGKSGVVSLSGDAWYQQQAARAVNQAIGRAIRHRNDWGAVLLCDDRFNAAHTKKQLPHWVQPFVKSFSSFGEVQWNMTQFFRNRATIEAAKPPEAKREEAPISAGHARNNNYLSSKAPLKIEYDMSGMSKSADRDLWDLPVSAAPKPALKSLMSVLNESKEGKFDPPPKSPPKASVRPSTSTMRKPTPLPPKTDPSTTSAEPGKWSNILGGPPREKRSKEESKEAAVTYFAEVP